MNAGVLLSSGLVAGIVAFLGILVNGFFRRGPTRADMTDTIEGVGSRAIEQMDIRLRARDLSIDALREQTAALPGMRARIAELEDDLAQVPALRGRLREAEQALRELRGQLLKLEDQIADRDRQIAVMMRAAQGSIRPPNGGNQ